MCVGGCGHPRVPKAHTHLGVHVTGQRCPLGPKPLAGWRGWPVFYLRSLLCPPPNVKSRCLALKRALGKRWNGGPAQAVFRPSSPGALPPGFYFLPRLSGRPARFPSLSPPHNFKGNPGWISARAEWGPLLSFTFLKELSLPLISFALQNISSNALSPPSLRPSVPLSGACFPATK